MYPCAENARNWKCTFLYTAITYRFMVIGAHTFMGWINLDTDTYPPFSRSFYTFVHKIGGPSESLAIVLFYIL